MRAVATLLAETRIADGTVDRSKIYLGTKLNCLGHGAENEARGMALHGHDTEMVLWQGSRPIPAPFKRLY